MRKYQDLRPLPQIGMSGVPQVRVGVVGRCYAINRQSYAFSYNSRIIVRVTVTLHSASPHAISCNLHSNVCDYLAIALFTNFRISTRTTNYQSSINDAYSSKDDRLREIFHKVTCLLIEESYNDE